MPSSKHAIILIPGMDSREKDAVARRLVRGLVNCVQHMEVREEGQASLSGEKAVKLSVVYPDASAVEFHVFEAFWWDLSLAAPPRQAPARILEGTALLVYWFFSGIWKSLARSSWYMTVGLLFSSLLMMAWYYSILAVGLTAIGTDPQLVSQLGGQSAFKAVLTSFGAVGKWMGSWHVWVLVSALLGFVPLNAMEEISSFVKRYLQNEAGADDVGCRDRIRHRMKGIIDEVNVTGGYQSVTVVAHSFGTVIATDFLAEYVPYVKTKLRFVTLGSPMEVLGYRSAWLRAEIQSCLKNAAITEWYDFYSRDDWMCSKVPGHGTGKGQVSRRQIRESSLLEKLSGESHKAYYQSQEIMETLVAVP